MRSSLSSFRATSMGAAFDAALVLAIGMGFGRFAFTAVYPHMVDEGLLSLEGGSLAASANYAGYLLGALLAVRAKAERAHRICLWSMAGTAVCLAAMAFLSSTGSIVAVRGVAGVCSALTLVAASSWLFETRNAMHRAPLLYAGVGVGIALSAEILVGGNAAGLGSHGLWLLLAAVSVCLGLIAVPGLSTISPILPTVRVKASGHARQVRPWLLVVVYGLAGLGYIVTATYLPLLVKSALPNLDAAHVWAVFGMAAAPSCFLWHDLHERQGTRATLVANLALQAIGVGLPVFSQTAPAYLLSALLVGSTFMGTVTIAMPAAQRVAGQVKGNLMAVMTIVYGVGQILGPLLSSYLYARSHSLFSSLTAAATALLGAAVISAFALDSPARKGLC